MNEYKICEDCKAHGCDRDFDKDGNEIDLCVNCPVKRLVVWEDE